MSDRKKCPHCEGFGSLPPYDVHDRCTDCKGTGWVTLGVGHFAECDCGSTPKDRIASLESDLATLRAERDAMAKALAWYANMRLEVIVECGGGMCQVPQRIQLGDKALNALQGAARDGREG